MIISITGSRNGANQNQKDAIYKIIKSSNCTEFHHGDCLGVDSQSHSIVELINFAREPNIRIESHPCTLTEYRAYTLPDFIHAVLPPIERNHVMVDLCDLLLIIPDTKLESSRSGTWATMRYARKLGKEFLMIYP